MEEKYESFKQKILKLNELALRGEEGEAINARKAMVRLCSTLGVNLEDILNESEQKKEYVFNVGCDHLLKELFFMCSEKILGDGEIWYKEKNSHISLELTPSQYAELFTYFDFHKENFKKELKELPVLLYLQGSPTFETATQNTESGRGASGCSFTKLSICSLNQNAFLPLKTTTRLPLHSMAALPTSWSNMSTFSIVQLILVLLLPCLHLSHR